MSESGLALGTHRKTKCGRLYYSAERLGVGVERGASNLDVQGLPVEPACLRVREKLLHPTALIDILSDIPLGKNSFYGKHGSAHLPSTEDATHSGANCDVLVCPFGSEVGYSVT